MVRPGETSSLEGGDILVLSPQVLAVGISQRTQEDSIDKFAHTILSISKTFQKILAFDIPKTRSFMHLDTVFTMVDRDKFTVHPNILHEITVFVMELVDGKIKIQEEQGRLEDILKRHLGLDQVKLIKCGSDSPIDAAREQWSDGKQHPGHRPRGGGGLRAELRDQPRPGGQRHHHPHHPLQRAQPGAGRAQVYVDALHTR